MFKKGKKPIDVPIRENKEASIRRNSFINFSTKNYIKCVSDQYNKKNILPLLLVEIMDRDNLIYMTLDEMSEEFSYPKTSISTLLSQLRRNDFIKRVKNGVYMINPLVAFRGNAQDREKLVEKYLNIK